MIKQKYVGFADRDDVAAAFEEGTGNKWSDNFTAALDFPTDDEIIYAEYDQGSYEGSAFVLYETGGKLYEVHGSHCSCMGLENQWAPEETTWAALAIRHPYGAPADVIEMARDAALAEAEREIKA